MPRAVLHPFVFLADLAITDERNSGRELMTTPTLRRQWKNIYA
jgi:hypothetical protein